MTPSELQHFVHNTYDDARKFLADNRNLDGVQKLPLLIDRSAQAVRTGRKIMFFGNGGSYAQAQHFAAELMGRFRRDRKTIPALALSSNGAEATAMANDYGYEFGFVRSLEGLARPGDVVIGLTTSGRSKNVLNALDYASKLRHCYTVAWTGSRGLNPTHYTVPDLTILCASNDTARVQEFHQILGHIYCAGLEEVLYGESTRAKP